MLLPLLILLLWLAALYAVGGPFNGPKGPRPS